MLGGGVLKPLPISLYSVRPPRQDTSVSFCRPKSIGSSVPLGVSLMNFKDVLSAVALSDRATGSLPPASCDTLYIYIDRHLCVCHGTYQPAQRLYRMPSHVDKTKKSLITEKYNHLYTDCRHCAGRDNVIRKAHEREVSGLFSLRWACSPLMLIPIIACFVFPNLRVEAPQPCGAG